MGTGLHAATTGLGDPEAGRTRAPGRGHPEVSCIAWRRCRYLGVPYHRGYLLYGPPGTGKTSLVSGLAAQFGMSVYAVNLTEFNDRTLKSAINNVPQNAVILFEDIDCMKTGNRRVPEPSEQDTVFTRLTRDKEDPGGGFGVSLSGLLSVLDGFHAPENVLFRDDYQPH